MFAGDTQSIFALTNWPFSGIYQVFLLFIMKTLPKFLFVFLSALILTAWPGAWAAEEKSNDKILFLHLKYKDGVVSLIDVTSRPGTLKTPPHSRGDIQVEMLSTDGQALWNTAIEDPCLQHVEYEDPDNPGQMKRVERRLTETEFWVRVPFHVKGKQVVFSKKLLNGGIAAQAGKQALGAVDISTVKEGR